MIDIIMGYVVQYTPVALSIVLTIINIKKVVNGIKLLDVYTPIDSLRKELKAEFKAFMGLIEGQKAQIEELKKDIERQKAEITEYKDMMAQNIEAQKKVIEEQAVQIKTLVSNNVELRAKARRKTDDSERV